MNWKDLFLIELLFPAESGEMAVDGGQSPEYDDISDDDLDEIVDQDQENGDKARKGENAFVLCVHCSFRLPEDHSTEVDALGIDWQSLAADSAPRQSTNKGTLQRFAPAALLAQVGFSEKYAGQTLTKKATELCKQFFSEENKERPSEEEDAQEGEQLENTFYGLFTHVSLALVFATNINYHY
jgi:hypothetical protein